MFIFKFLYEISLGWLNWNFLNSYTKGIYRTKKSLFYFYHFYLAVTSNRASLLKFERLIYESCKNGHGKWEVEVQFRLSTSSEFLRDFLINRWRCRYTNIQGMWWNIDDKTFYEERVVKYMLYHLGIYFTRQNAKWNFYFSSKNVGKNLKFCH